VASSLGVATAFAVGAVMLPFRAHLSIATAGLVLVIPVVVGVITGGYVGGVASILAGFLIFDFAYIPPYNTLTVGQAQNWVPLGVYAVVMLLVAQVVAHLRTARAQAQRREAEARRLYLLSELLVENGSLDELLETIVRAISTVFDVEDVAVLLPADGGLRVVAAAGTPLQTEQLHALQPTPGVPVAVGSAGTAGQGLRTLILTAASGPVGMLVLRDPSGPPADDALLRTFANHAALALERVQLRTVAQRSALLEEVDRVRRDLVGAVSHDLRTPLATMKVATSTLLDVHAELTAEESRELYALLDIQTDRLTRLVTSLLDMNRFESGVLQVDRRPSLVLDLVGEAVAGLRPALGERAVVLEFPANLPPVDVDPVLMVQVVTNLVDNADRHSPEGEVIRVGAELKNDLIELSVTDHGKGVPDDERQSVFHSFVRFDTGGRAGLGLAIVKAFVEAHGERVWVEDGPNGGARFVLTMPISRTSGG
jgi:two-component system, OmpR family, sensor histidine kinase KdpD